MLSRRKFKTIEDIYAYYKQQYKSTALSQARIGRNMYVPLYAENTFELFYNMLADSMREQGQKPTASKITKEIISRQKAEKSQQQGLAIAKAFLEKNPDVKVPINLLAGQFRVGTGPKAFVEYYNDIPRRYREIMAEAMSGGTGQPMTRREAMYYARDIISREYYGSP